MADEEITHNQPLQLILDVAPFDLRPRIKVVCIGDAAGKVCEQLRRRPMEGTELILIDAHIPPLRQSDATIETNASTAHIHASLAIDQLAVRIAGAKLVVIVTCLEDGTAELTRTVAVLSRPTDALVIALVATAVECREQQARESAERELESLESAVDVLIHVPMSDYCRLITHDETHAAIPEGASLALTQAVRALLLPVTDHRNLLGVDFCDLREVFRRQGKGAFAVGSGYGDDLGTETILAAVGEEGLMVGGARLSEAKSLWLVIEGGEGLPFCELERAVALLRGWVSEDTPFIFSVFFAPELDMEMRATILTAGHESFCFQSPPNYQAHSDLAASFRRATEMAMLIKRGEQRAQELITQLLPGQAERYREAKFIEADSRLFPGAYYRIHLGGYGHRTDLIANERTIATLCLTLRSHRLPPSDRVLAEYFLIRGDEDKYLKTANIRRKEATGPQDEPILAKLFQGERNETIGDEHQR